MNHQTNHETAETISRNFDAMQKADESNRPVSNQASASGPSLHYLGSQLADWAQNFAEHTQERKLLIMASNKLIAQDNEIASMRGRFAEAEQTVRDFATRVEMAKFVLAARVYPS
jgi:hypothetical protein